MSYRENNLSRLIYDTVAGYIEDQEKRKGGVRSWYADIMLANNLRNKEFVQVCGLLEDDFDDIADEVDRTRRMTEEQILQKVIPGLVDGHLAYLIVNDRRTAESLDDRTYNDMLRHADAWEDIWLNNPPPARTGREEPRGRQPSQRGRREYGRDDYNYRDDTRSSVTYNRQANRGGRETVRPGMFGNIRLVSENQMDEDDQSVVEPVEAPVRQPRNTPAPVKPIDINGIDWTKSKPHYEYHQDGERWVFCKHSDADALEAKLSHPPTFVDINHGLRFLVQGSDNNIREEIVNVTNDTRYLQHELMTDLSNRDGSGRRTRVSLIQKTEPDVAEVSETAVVTERTSLAKVLNLTKLTQDFEKYASQSTAPMLVVSMKEAVEDTRLKLNDDKDTVLGRVYFVRDLVSLMSQNTVTENEPIMDKLDNATTLTQFHEILDTYKDTMDTNLWRKINQRMSNQLGLSMRYQWRTPAKNELNFHSTYPVMIAKLLEKKGPEWMAKFGQRAPALIERVMSRLQQDEVSTFITDSLSTNTDANKVVVFMDYEYVIGINRTADALGIGNQLVDKRSGVAVRELESSSLPSVIRGIYAELPLADRARQMVQPVRLVTSDYQIVTILPYMARHDEFILSQPTDTL